MAVATDCNPGTSPLTSLLLAMNMACTLFRLTPQEALAGATRNAARALGLARRRRHASRPARRADFALWDIARPADLAYGIGQQSLPRRGERGRPARPSHRHRELRAPRIAADACAPTSSPRLRGLRGRRARGAAYFLLRCATAPRTAACMSHATCRCIQNAASLPKYIASRTAVSGVIARRPLIELVDAAARDAQRRGELGLA